MYSVQSQPPRALPFFSMLLSPLLFLISPPPLLPSRPLLFLALLHTQRRKDLDSSWDASSGPLLQLSCLHNGSLLFAWPFFCFCSPLSSSPLECTCTHAQLPTSLHPAAPVSCLPPLLPAPSPACGCDRKASLLASEGGPPTSSSRGPSLSLSQHPRSRLPHHGSLGGSGAARLRAQAGPGHP